MNQYAGHRSSEFQSPRLALMSLLDGLSESHTRIVYIHAPAGFGKTVSSHLWIKHRETIRNAKMAVVSLDKFDDKPSAFCKRFVSALTELEPENTQLAAVVQHPVFETAPIEFALHAIELLKEKQNENILVFDDLHVIENTDILNLLLSLFRRMSTNIIVLLLSRAPPPDCFSEVVAKGELALVSAEQLQFTRSEIKNFFLASGKQLSGSELDEVLSSTGGWAIGIRAVLLSDGNFHGAGISDRYLASYLKTHVWERWDERTKLFMKLVSVAEELTPELCKMLTAGKKHAKAIKTEDMLAQLEHESAFLRVVGKNKYKFHDLFRDFLLSMLEHENMLSVQHNKAAKYYYETGDYFRAMQYYLSAGNDAGVAESIFHMYNYKSSFAAVEDTLNTVMPHVTPELVEKHPFLLEVQAWCAFVDGRSEDFEYFLDTYFKQLPRILLKTPRSAIVSFLLRCIDYREDVVEILKKIKLIPFKGNVRAFTPSISQGIPYFHRSCRDFSDFANNLEEAVVLTDKALSAIIGHEWSVMRECVYAGIYYEQGNLSKAHEHATTAYTSIRQDCSAEIRLCAMSILLAILAASGQFEEAAKFKGYIEDMITQESAFYLRPNMRAIKFFEKLIDGDKAAAAQWLEEYDESTNKRLALYKIPQHYTTARAYIVKGDFNGAIILLKRMLTFANSYNRPLDVIETSILLAIAYNKKGRSGSKLAIEHLEQAIMVAYKYGFTQQFMVEGPELKAMLQTLSKRAQQPSSKEDETKALPAEFIKTLYIAAVEGAAQNKGLTGGKISTGVTFTDKQKDVMHLMCAGHSRAEIAKKMGLKPSGVKSHAQLIYQKLSVSNSTEAILKIKEYGYLDE
ncbi:MAG: LuxR C-terminal-related transcriptional regulator [Oscillospiraceae bacterium]|nr:LuxR C-terminal-related transcriptional regulator [Oscillospiraceae bacterium]